MFSIQLAYVAMKIVNIFKNMLFLGSVLGYIFLINIMTFIPHNYLLCLLLRAYYVAGNELDTKDTTVES